MRARKIILHLRFFLFIILINSAYASMESCTNGGGQIIATLYQGSNSHIAIYNQSAKDINAGINICYDDFFGEYTGSNQWECTGRNSIVNIFRESNSHASEISYNQYEQKICYGDLRCALRDNACNDDEKIIMSMNERTNAHVSYGNDPAYKYKICCKKSDSEPSEILNISIAGLEDGKAYFSGIPVSVAFNVENEADEAGIQVTWSIPEEGFSTNNLSFLANFTTAGQKTIRLIAENGNGARANIEINVLSVGGDGMLTYIRAPKYRDLIKISGIEAKTGIKELLYDGRGSFVLKSNYDIIGCASGEVICVAGECPDNIPNYPQCAGSAVLVRENNKDYSNMHFSWSENNIQPAGRIKEGNGELGGKIYYPNTKFSKMPNDKEIILRLKYNSDGINLQGELRRNFTLGQCVYNSRAWISDILYGVEYASATIDPVKYGRSSEDPLYYNSNACKGPDKENGNMDDCCPSGYACTKSDGCVIKNNYIAGCDAKSGTNKETCERTPWNEVKDAGNIDNKCGAAKKYCKWENNKCIDSYEYINITNKANPANKSVSYHNLTDCDKSTGTWLVNITTKCYYEGCKPSDKCDKSEVETLSCGRPAFKLPAFGIWQFLITGVAIALIYAFGIFLKRK